MYAERSGMDTTALCDKLRGSWTLLLWIDFWTSTWHAIIISFRCGFFSLLSSLSMLVLLPPSSSSLLLLSRAFIFTIAWCNFHENGATMAWARKSAKIHSRECVLCVFVCIANRYLQLCLITWRRIYTAFWWWLQCIFTVNGVELSTKTLFLSIYVLRLVSYSLFSSLSFSLSANSLRKKRISSIHKICIAKKKPYEISMAVFLQKQ